MHRRFFIYISRFACHFGRTLALTIKKILNEIYGVRRPRVLPKIGLWLAGQNCIKMNVVLHCSVAHIYENSFGTCVFIFMPAFQIVFFSSTLSRIL